MTFQGHSYCKPFKCDFLHARCYREFVRRLSVRSSQVGVLLRRPNAKFQKYLRKIAQKLQFYDAKDIYRYEILIVSSPTGRQIAFDDRSNDTKRRAGLSVIAELLVGKMSKQ